MSGTRVYGASDDLIEFEGDVDGEVGYFSSEGQSALVVCSDGTVLLMHYGEPGIWRITILTSGALYCGKQECKDEDADPHSDVVSFQPGLKWAHVATEWQRVK